MEKYFGINEVSAMTGLTTRTLRNYIKSGALIGEKVESATIAGSASFSSAVQTVELLVAQK